MATGAAVLGLSIGSRQDARADLAQYFFPAAPSVVGLGACNSSAESINCWDMDGHPDQALTGRVKEFVISPAGRELYLPQALGMKNRLLVLQVANGRALEAAENLDGPDPMIVPLTNDAVKPSTYAVPAAFERAATDATLKVRLSGPAGRTLVKLRFLLDPR